MTKYPHQTPFTKACVNAMQWPCSNSDMFVGRFITKYNIINQSSIKTIQAIRTQNLLIPLHLPGDPILLNDTFALWVGSLWNAVHFSPQLLRK